MSTNKSELVEVVGYGYIYSNNKAANYFIVRCEYVPYDLQKDVWSYGNTLAYGDIVYNTIYIYARWPKSCLCVEPVKYLESVFWFMRTFAIPYIHIKIWTQKIIFHKVTTFIN